MNSEVKTEFDTATDLLQLVTFKLGNEEFGLDILKVKEIIKPVAITKMPNSPYYVEGVINLRGEVIPVINLRKRLNLAENEQNSKTRIIVIETNKKTTGFIVDEVNEVLRIPENIMEATPELVSGVDSEYIIGVGKLDDRLLIHMDIEKILIG